MKCVLIVFASFYIYHATHAQTDVSLNWTKSELRAANKARFAWYMSRRSKKSIKWMNLARMYGSKFSRMYLEDIEPIPNVESLINRLNFQKSLPPLRPSFGLWFSAFIHAKDTGKNGAVGHGGFENRMKLAMPLGLYRSSGENCDYGNSDPFDAILALLIDEDVPSLGHRKNILNKEFVCVGSSFARHKVYNITSVYNFASAGWWERLFKQ